MDAHHFVETYRRGKAFLGYTRVEIIREIRLAVEHKAFGYVMNQYGLIAGIVTAEIDHGCRVVRIKNILTSSKGAMQSLVSVYNRLCPGYRIVAKRRGRYVEYDTDRLLKHLTLTKKAN